MNVVSWGCMVPWGLPITMVQVVEGGAKLGQKLLGWRSWMKMGSGGWCFRDCCGGWRFGHSWGVWVPSLWDVVLKSWIRPIKFCNQWPCLVLEHSRERLHRLLWKIVQSTSAFESTLDSKWVEKDFAHFVDACAHVWTDLLSSAQHSP